MMEKRIERFKSKVKELVGDEYTVTGDKIIDGKILIKHNCEDCNNNEWYVRLKNFTRTNKPTRCPVCSLRIRNSKLTKTNEQFLQEVKELIGDEYTFLEEYSGDHTKILVRHNCKDCNNNEWKVEPNQFLRKQGTRCPVCSKTVLSKKNSKSHNTFLEEITKLVGDEYTVIDKYKRNDEKIKFKHNVCNTIFEMRPYDFLNNHRCPKCAGNMKKDTSIFKKEIFDLVGGEYTLLDEYINDSTKVRFQHNSDNCNNHIFEMKPNDFHNGRRCPKCSVLNHKSNEEIELCNYIKDIIKDESLLDFNNRTILNSKELDIVIQNLNIAFEYDGLFWHTEEKGCSNRYHLDKTNECKDKGIQLIHIFSDEWNNNKDLVKSKISHLLNKNNNDKIYARKCSIREISASEKNLFLNKNHIQGADRASIKLGLFYDDKLVSVMTFCKPRISLGQNNSSSYDYELSRFASDINLRVIGGFGKLFNYFKNNYEWNNLLTYADKRWSKGNVYIKNGWKHIHDSKPSYWYTNGRERFHRYGFRKQELKNKFPDIYDKDLTEFEIMSKTQYCKIWDCGNMVFEYSREGGN